MSGQGSEQAATGQGAAGAGEQAAGAQQPALRVERGNPSAEDIAALVAILAASTDSQDGPASTARLFGWAARAPRMRAPHPRGPGAWRSGSIPR